MSKEQGFSLHRVEDTLVGIGVSARNAGRWQVDTVTRRPLGEDLPDDLARAMTRDVDGVTWLLPDADVASSLAALPRLKGRELRRAIEGWVARKEGGQPGQWALSWRVLADGPLHTGKDQQCVFALHAPREAVDAQIAAAEPWDIRPGRMLPPSMILDQLFRRVGDRDGVDVWNLVYIGADTSFLCVASRSCLLLTRPLPHDLSGGTDPEEYLERLATEVDRSVLFARQTEGSPEVDRIVICGDADLSSKLALRLADVSNVPTVHWALNDLFEWDGRDIPTDLLIPMAAAALSTLPIDFNLLPAVGRRLLGPRSRRRLIVGAMSAAAALVPVLIVGGMLTGAVQDRYLQDAREQLVVARERADDAARIYDRHRMLLARQTHLDAAQNIRGDLEGVLLQLAAVTPAEVTYRDLQVIDKPERTMLYLTGESSAGSSAVAQAAFMRFLAALDGSSFLASQGEPRYLQITEQDDQGTIRKTVIFSLDYELVANDAKEEG